MSLDTKSLDLQKNVRYTQWSTLQNASDVFKKCQ